MAETRRLRWLSDAVQDLQRLDDFIRPHSSDAANHFLTAVQDAVQSLEAHPELGRPSEFDSRFRELAITFGRRGYVLRYRLDPEAVVIVRLWHALEDRV